MIISPVKMMEVACDNCTSLFLRATKEVTRCRKNGRRMFCSPSCDSEARVKPSKRDAICVKCGNCFISNKCKGKWSKYCSRSCASADSITDWRREQAKRTGKESLNLLTVSETMKLREEWKYLELKEALWGVHHEFEFPLAGYVFDLVIHGNKLLVEFDGPDHRNSYSQMDLDNKKDLVAKENGFRIVRIEVEARKVIPKGTLNAIWLRTSTPSG